MRKSLMFVIIIVLLIPILVLSSVIYYRNGSTSIYVAQQPFEIEEPNVPYITDFVKYPTGIYINISISSENTINLGNNYLVNLTIMKINVLRGGSLTFNLSAVGSSMLLIRVYSDNGSLIGEYPNNTVIILSPGNYIVTEEIVFPTGIDSILINGNYIFSIGGVSLTYELRETVIING